ncbi:MAG: hypothetical protein ACRDKK_02180 [Gaiellaceae bacterium]
MRASHATLAFRVAVIERNLAERTRMQVIVLALAGRAALRPERCRAR